MLNFATIDIEQLNSYLPKTARIQEWRSYERGPARRDRRFLMTSETKPKCRGGAGDVAECEATNISGRL